MTMLLLSTVVVPVKPVPGKKYWFAFSGKPRRCEYDDIEELLIDCGKGARIKGARVVGLHDNESIMDDDPRFNYRSDGNECVVVRDGDEYVMVMLVNAPEALVLMYMFDLEGQPGAEPFPPYKEGAAEAEEAMARKMEAERESWRAKMDAVITRYPSTPKTAPKKAAKKPAAKPKAGARV